MYQKNTTIAEIKYDNEQNTSHVVTASAERFRLTRLTCPATAGKISAYPPKSADCEEEMYVAGEAVTLRVNLQPYYHLDHWSENVDALSQTIVMPSANTTVTATLKAYLEVGAYDDTHPSICYHKTWCMQDNPVYYEKTQHFTAKRGAKATFMIQGNQVGLIYTCASIYGKLAIKIDGQPLVLLDQFSEYPAYQKQWLSGHLVDGVHKITLVYSSSNPIGRYVNIDGILVK